MNNDSILRKYVVITKAKTFAKFQTKIMKSTRLRARKNFHFFEQKIWFGQTASLCKKLNT